MKPEKKIGQDTVGDFSSSDPKVPALIAAADGTPSKPNEGLAIEASSVFGYAMEATSAEATAIRAVGERGGLEAESAQYAVNADGALGGVYAHHVEGHDAYLALPNLAAQFDGDVDVNGHIKSLPPLARTDHPADPEGRYLAHAFVGCAERIHLYDGCVQADARGEAVVRMPSWFGALHESVRYQLTPIGAPAPDLHVARELRDGSFALAGARPGMSVAWQVTGVRADAWARANPLAVEVEKPDAENGRYLCPQAYGASADRAIRRQPAVTGRRAGEAKR